MNVEVAGSGRRLICITLARTGNGAERHLELLHEVDVEGQRRRRRRWRRRRRRRQGKTGCNLQSKSKELGQSWKLGKTR